MKDESLRRCERCGGKLQRRPDANLEALDRKLDSFYKHENPMLQFLDRQKRLVDVPVSGNVDRDLYRCLGVWVLIDREDVTYAAHTSLQG